MEKKDRDIHIRMVWERMKAGDEQSLSEIFTLFYSDLYQYGIKIFSLPDLVRDSIQDVFVRVWERRQTIGEISHPKAYLIASLRRRLFRNKKMLDASLSAQLIDPDAATFSFAPSEFMEIAELSAQLRQSLVNAINTLPERQRELIFLRFNYGLRYLEISHIMEVNEQTVRNLMQRALANLRSQIDRRLWEGNDNPDELLLTLFLLFSKK